MGAISDDVIRERAYRIWEREGRPHGRDFEHWVRAQVELIAEGSANNSGRKAAAARPPVATAKSVAPKPSRPASARSGRVKKRA